MSNEPNRYQPQAEAYAIPEGMGGFMPAAMAAAQERRAFIQKTYLHVAGAVGLFGVLLLLAVTLVPAQTIANAMVSGGLIGWFVIMALFMVGSSLAHSLAQPTKPLSVQYFGLALYVAIYVAIFLPLMAYIGLRFRSFDIVFEAAILTLALAGGLTTAALFTGKDFSFLGPIVNIGCWAALGLIVVAAIFGMNLGLFFGLAMIGLMSAAILYETSQVLHRYPTSAYVAASLAIFAAVITMFYYVIRVLMSSRN